MERSRISAYFFLGAVVCLIINVIIAPQPSSLDADLFPILSGTMIIFLLTPMIMALKELEDFSGRRSLGNAKSCGLTNFFILTLISSMLPLTEDIHLGNGGLFVFLFILSDILCFIGAIVYESSAPRTKRSSVADVLLKPQPSSKPKTYTDEEIQNLPSNFWLIPSKSTEEIHSKLAEKEYKCLNCNNTYTEHPSDHYLLKGDIEANNGKKYRIGDDIKVFTVPRFKYVSIEKFNLVFKYEYSKPYPFREQIVKHDGLYYLDENGFVVGEILTSEKSILPLRDGERPYREENYYPEQIDESKISCSYCADCLTSNFGNLTSSRPTLCINCDLQLVDIRVHRCGACKKFTCTPCWNSGVQACKACGSTYFDT